jgi:hypothetical protein
VWVLGVRGAGFMGPPTNLKHQGFRVSGVGVRVSGFGFRVRVSGFGIRVEGQGSGLRV